MKTIAFPRRPMPDGVRVRQNLPTDHVPDVRHETCRRLLDAGLRERVGRGHRIAITAGSRGMGGFVDLLGGIVDAVKAAGGIPFLVPAMGSHGGAVAAGQIEILRRLDVSEDTVGAPVHATMETVPLGSAENGAVAHLDRFAAEADGIIVLGRIKTHPESTGPLASGLLKMTVIGLGNQHGAQEAHSHGLWDSIRAVPRLHLSRAKILFGVAVIENGYRQPVVIEAVPGTYDAFLEADERLLDIAKAHFAEIPFQDLDLLIVDEIGKTIAGTCMDPNVIGKWRVKSEGPRVPNFRRIAALSLTHGSLGNGLGVGMADFVTERFSAEFDPGVTAVNLLTATEPGSWNSQEALLPIALPSDREAAEVALYSALGGAKPSVCRIRNTACLGEFWVSEALLPEVRENPKLSILSDPAPMSFDGEGNLF